MFITHFFWGHFHAASHDFERDGRARCSAAATIDLGIRLPRRLLINLSETLQLQQKQSVSGIGVVLLHKWAYDADTICVSPYYCKPSPISRDDA